MTPQHPCTPGYHPLLRSKVIPPRLHSKMTAPLLSVTQTGGLCKSSPFHSAVCCDYNFLFSRALQSILANLKTAPILLSTALCSCLTAGKRPLFCWIYGCSKETMLTQQWKAIHVSQVQTCLLSQGGQAWP